jgi:hypothetical protein
LGVCVEHVIEQLERLPEPRGPTRLLKVNGLDP